METLIEWGRGPLFRFSVAIALLGLLRYAALSCWGLCRALRKAGDKRFPLGQLLARTATTLNPVRYLLRDRWLYTLLSVAFHVGVILVPIFFLGHVELWRRAIGIGWPALPASAADLLALLTMATGLLLVVARAASVRSRALSRGQDWLMPPLIALEFLTGYLLAHPASNPFDLQQLTLLHVWLGDLLLVTTPFSKVAHCVMLPFSQLASEMAWRLVPGAGIEAEKTLGKEAQPL